MNRRQVYFRDTNIVECWTCFAGRWAKVDADAFDDLSDYEYFAFDSKPESWLGDRRENPMPYIAW